MLISRWGVLSRILGSLAWAGWLAAAEPSSANRLAFQERAGAIEIVWGERIVAEYVYRHDQIPRPFFAHLRAPDGTQVTRNQPPQAGRDDVDHETLHPGVWLAFGDINGQDIWRNRAAIRHQRFTESPQVTDQGLTFATESQLLTSDGQPFGALHSRISFWVRPVGQLLIWDATLAATEQDLVLGDQEEMGLGVRVATPLIEKNGGLITSSDGTTTAQKTWGKAHDWCDYSRVVDGRRVGVVLMPDPANFRRSWFHNRDYGLMVANAFGRQAMQQGEVSRVEVKRGETLRLRYGVFLYALPESEQLDLSAVFRDYGACLAADASGSPRPRPE